MAFPGRALQKCWHLVDASEQTVGRLAAQVAPILKGKHKPTFRPNKDMGDVVVIVNAEKVHFSGKKWDDKLYRWHTGYPGGLKERPAKMMLEKNPTKILRKAILGMLYRNNLRQSYMKPRLKIYTGPTHPHTAQLPEGTEPLPKHPRKRSGQYHYGLQHYMTPGTYLSGTQPTGKAPKAIPRNNLRVVKEITNDDDDERFEQFEEYSDVDDDIEEMEIDEEQSAKKLTDDQKGK